MTDLPLDAAHRALASNPRLGPLLEELLELLSAPHTTVAVTGSVARGEVDQWSDLDLVVRSQGLRKLATMRRAVQAHLRDRYEVVALFDAAHLGLDCLDSAFLVMSDVIVKVDVTYWPSSTGPIPGMGLVLHDGPGIGMLWGANADEVMRAPHDLPGWICHTRKISARGELFETAHCLNEMRRRFLVPVLLEVNGSPQVNYRRIEGRLPETDLDALRGTVPCGLDAAALDAALDNLVRAFQETYRRLPASRRGTSVEDLEHRTRLAQSLPVS